MTQIIISKSSIASLEEEILKKEIEPIMTFHRKATLKLDALYKECDEEGHQELQNNYCSHCYRHTKIKKPRSRFERIPTHFEQSMNDYFNGIFYVKNKMKKDLEWTL